MELAAQQWNNLPGWVALILIIIDRMIVPLARQYFPIKVKTDANKHQIELEDQRFDHEMKIREIEAQENIARIVGYMDKRIGDVEAEVKIISTDVKTVIREVGELKPKRKAR